MRRGGDRCRCWCLGSLRYCGWSQLSEDKIMVVVVNTGRFPYDSDNVQ